MLNRQAKHNELVVVLWKRRKHVCSAPIKAASSHNIVNNYIHFMLLYKHRSMVNEQRSYTHHARDHECVLTKADGKASGIFFLWDECNRVLVDVRDGWQKLHALG